MKAQRRPDGSYSPPFSVRSLDNNCRDSSDVPPSDDKLLSLLPASYRTESDDLVASSCAVEACVKKELDLQRLTDILNWLWIAGRPMPPRPLHYQLLLSRDIFAKERIDMHLVWTTGRIFLKPLPRFLLEPRFWTPHLSCDRSCRCPAEEDAPRSPGGVPTCEQKKLWKGALGFLFSYAALITHETDFWIAKEKLLLPPEVSWSDWRTLVLQLDTEHIYARIDPRFIYGELRLSLLNKIYYLSRTPLRATCLAGSVYIAAVLTAMQVGLATDALSGNGAFQSAPYGFTIFSILGPLVAAGLIVAVFCYLFVDNWVATVAYKKKRCGYIAEHSTRNTP